MPANSAADNASLNVSDFVNSAAVGGFHLLILLLCSLIMIMDGFDLISMGMVVPTLSDDWQMPQVVFSQHLVSPLSAVLFGVVFGSIGAGWLADRFGRRPVVILMLVLAAVCMLLTTTASGLNELVVYRFFTGIGAGGSIPIGIAIATEFVPEKFRSLMVMAMYTGAPLGASLGGLIGPELITAFGWQGIFWFGGIGQLLIAGLLWFLLPESVKFMARQPGSRDSLRALLQRIRPDAELAAVTDFTFTQETATRSSIMALFSENRARLTLALWLIFFAMQFVLFFVSLMMPAYLKADGWTSTDALRPLGFYNLGAFFGGVAIGLLASRIGPARSLLISLPTSALLLVALGLFVGQNAFFLALTFLAGAITIGSGMALAPLAAGVYPTEARSTGVGASLGVGRGGSIIAPFIGAIGLNAALGADGFFYTSAIAPLVCFVGVTLLMFFQRSDQRTAASQLA